MEKLAYDVPVSDQCTASLHCFVRTLPPSAHPRVATRSGLKFLMFFTSFWSNYRLVPLLEGDGINTSQNAIILCSTNVYVVIN